MGDAAPARRRLSLGAIHALLNAVGNPERGLSIVHVAGSKGKGSVCLAAEAMLTALGERVGVFTSPHFERWTERFRVNVREVSGAALARAVARLQPHVDRLRSEDPENSPSFFDATTAAALLIFKDAGVDRVLLEVGLGGRLDSTNAVSPLVTCITQIELEHQEVLGHTLAAIAGEKAGILKPGVPCVVGALPPPAEAAVAQRAAEVGAPVFREGEAFTLEVAPASMSQTQTRLRYRERGGFTCDADLPIISVPGARNAGLALASLRRLGGYDDGELVGAAQRGLAALTLPGRVEVVSREPWVIIDSAHTPASAIALADTLASLGLTEVELILSISRDKALPEILTPLLPHARAVTVTAAEPLRSVPPLELAEAIGALAPDLALRVAHDPRSGLRDALASVQAGTAVVVAGSVYLAGAAREVVRERAEGSLSARLP